MRQLAESDDSGVQFSFVGSHPTAHSCRVVRHKFLGTRVEQKRLHQNLGQIASSYRDSCGQCVQTSRRGYLWPIEYRTAFIMDQKGRLSGDQKTTSFFFYKKRSESENYEDEKGACQEMISKHRINSSIKI